MGISRDKDDDGRRWYTDGDRKYLSVTEILDSLEEDESGLEYWKDQNDGVGDAAHHHHIYWYSGPRGTLCHYQALKYFEDSYDGDDMWGEEETKSMEKIIHGPTERDLKKWPEEASTDLDDITYSIMRDQGIVDSHEQFEHLFKGNTRLVDVLHEDISYFVESFETICELLGVDDDSVIRVEKLMLNDEDGYGGQCDLVYEDEDGNYVLADLKTSSSLRQKHRLQSVAYKHAVEQADWGPDEIDRVEVWRISPTNEEWQVHSHTVPSFVDHDDYTDEYWFDDKWGEFSYNSLDDMWDKFLELVDEAHAEAR